jgi:hypothetical protein
VGAKGGLENNSEAGVILLEVMVAGAVFVCEFACAPPFLHVLKNDGAETFFLRDLVPVVVDPTSPSAEVAFSASPAKESLEFGRLMINSPTPFRNEVLDADGAFSSGGGGGGGERNGTL